MEIITTKNPNGTSEVTVTSDPDYLTYFFRSRHEWVTKIGKIDGHTFKPDSREVSWVKVKAGGLSCATQEKLNEMHNYFWSSL